MTEKIICIDQRIIDLGVAKHISLCAIAFAILFEYKHYVRVNYSLDNSRGFINVAHVGEFRMTSDLLNWVIEFDAGKSVLPIKISLLNGCAKIVRGEDDNGLA